ncbi:glycosyltransferase family 2 protein [bacterium]|nr:glycosyltransferase family 2 protein [bacterium]
MRRPKVSMIVLTYNGWKLLDECLQNVLRQDYLDLEVLVVDNGSNDGTLEKMQQVHPDIRVLALEKNSGFAGANNAGVLHTQGEYVALVSNDVYLPINFVSNLVAALEADPQAALAGPGVYNLKMNMAHYPYVGSMGLTGTIIQHVFKDTTLSFGAAGCSLMFRRSMIPLPFDEDYGFFHEEVYLAWKARLQGYKVLRLPETVVKHIGGATVGGIGDENRFLIERNRWLNYLTLFSETTRKKISPLMQLSQWVESLADRRAGRSRAPVKKAHHWIKQNRSLIQEKFIALQKLRKVKDEDIIAWMSYKITTQDSPAGRFINCLAWRWCRISGLKPREILEKK